MENIALDLKVTELKQSSICKAMEELHSQASSVLLITLQWTDLQQHLDSIRTKLESLRQELAERENHIGLKEKELEAQRLQICSELELKEKRLNEVDSLFEERSRMIDSNERHIESLMVLIQENCEELEIKENKFRALNASFGKKEREFDQLNKRVAESKSRLDLLQKIIREAESEAESKAKEVESMGREVEKLRALLRKYHDDIELKDRQFNALRRSVEELREQVELKEKEFESAIYECGKEIKLKEEKLALLQGSVMECTAELQSKEQQLDSVREEVQLKEKHSASLTKLMEECYQKLGMKEAEFKGLFEELGLKENAMESKFEEVDSLYNKTNEFVKEVELKEKVIDEGFNELGAKEKQFVSRVKQFVLEKKEFEERRLKEKTNMVQVNIEQPDNDPPNNSSSTSSIYQSCISTSAGGGNLQLLLYQHLKRHDLVCSQIRANLRASSDPGKLVLDAIRGFYPPGGQDKEEDTDLRTVRRSCILLMEQLMTTSPSKISDKVREEARKLAADWKVKLKVETEDQLEVLGFLQLLAVFDLSSNFDADALRSLLQIVAHHRQAPVLRNALGIADKSPGEVEQVEYLSGNFATNCAPNLQPSTTKSGRSLHCRNEHLTRNDSANNEASATFQVSHDPAKIMLDMIEGVFIKYRKCPTRGCNANVMKDCISRFDQLMGFSPQIGPSVREDAKNLALEWEEKMRAVPENSFEILCFLQFLATYGLVSSFNADDILKLLEKISQHKEALELCTTLGFADNIPELVQTLIARNRHLDAVRLICSYKLVDKISPAPLLKEYLNLVKKSAKNICKRNKPAGFKAKARDERIAALRSVKQCVIDYSLESYFPLTNIDTRIDQLEKIKKESWTPSHASKPKVVPQQKKQNARTFDHNEQQQQQQNRNKCPRIPMSGSSGGPRGSSVVCTSEFPQVSLSNLHGVAMPANSHWQYGGVSANLGAGQNAGLRYSFDTLSKHY